MKIRMNLTKAGPNSVDVRPSGFNHHVPTLTDFGRFRPEFGQVRPDSIKVVGFDKMRPDVVKFRPVLRVFT